MKQIRSHKNSNYVLREHDQEKMSVTCQLRKYFFILPHKHQNNIRDNKNDRKRYLGETKLQESTGKRISEQN